jgi:hypothetical protein
MTIAVQFVASRSFGADLIELYSHSPYSHVDAVLADGQLLGARSETIGKIPPGVQVRPADYEAFTVRRRVELPATDLQATAFFAFLHGQLGKPYDQRAIAAFASGRDWRTPDAWFCSELVAAAMEAAGIFQWRLLDVASKIDPGDLALACSVLVNLGG